MNYQQELIKEIKQIQIKEPLLLHSCCAPCSSYVLEYLSEYFEIKVFYYNPNITEKLEYQTRVAEQEKFIDLFQPTKNPISFHQGNYEPEKFFAIAKGLEGELEGGKRCKKCYDLRLRETAKLAKELGYRYFTTTLTISPMKNAEILNQIGIQLGEEFGIRFLPSDFKKNNGYQKSILLSKKYDLYRQNYCGCVYSLIQNRTIQNKGVNNEKDIDYHFK